MLSPSPLSIAGCGKTILWSVDKYSQRSKLTQPLSSTVIQHVANHCKENVGFALAYFYFDFTDPVKQKASSLVTSFLTQLSFQLPLCPDILLKLHAACQAGSQQASTPDLMKALKSIIGYFHQVYFVIDALDECSDQDELLAVLTEIADWKLHNSHVLATSRCERYIEERLIQMVSSYMNINSGLVDKDIRCYLRTILVNDLRFRIWTVAERQETEDTMMERANGM